MVIMIEVPAAGLTAEARSVKVSLCGDIVMNFEMVAEMGEGPTATVLTNDDVAVESSLHSQARRGVAPLRDAWSQRRAKPGGQLLHLAGDGRLFDHAHQARR